MAISSELACVLNAVDEPAILIRPEDMTVAAANAAFLRTFGAFRFEGRRCWEAMHRSEDCALCGLGCPRREAMRTRQESVLEQTVFTSSRASRFRVALSPVYASDGSLRYWLERIRVEQGLGMNDMSRGQVGESALHQALMRELAKAAAAHYPVLIVGEKGLGKELYARTVHENSVRASRPFVAVPAEVLTESNFRELLFGRMRIRGSRGRTGLLSQAAGGTLFVDALEKLPLAVQEEVARVLEVGVFWPASAQVPMIAAFRFMASAALPITELVREKRLHESLARILEHHVVYVAPLRERKEDMHRWRGILFVLLFPSIPTALRKKPSSFCKNFHGRAMQDNCARRLSARRCGRTALRLQLATFHPSRKSCPNCSTLLAVWFLWPSCRSNTC